MQLICIQTHFLFFLLAPVDEKGLEDASDRARQDTVAGPSIFRHYPFVFFSSEWERSATAGGEPSLVSEGKRGGND